MRPVIPCPGCKLCVRDIGVGFAKGESLICARDGSDVSSDDGCTIGEPGKPSLANRPASVTIEGHEAVYQHEW